MRGITLPRGLDLSHSYEHQFPGLRVFLTATVVVICMSHESEETIQVVGSSMFDM